MCELLCEILSKCYEISTKSKADVFFEYSPHVGNYYVYFYRNGWTRETAGDMEFLAFGLDVNEDNMRGTIAKLNDIAAELGVA